MQTTTRHWQALGGIRDYHGVVTPLSAIRTHHSLGIGDMEDLRLMIDWLASTGFRVLQLLPIHDTGYEASPYLSLSSFSINPIYISLREAPLLPSEQTALKAFDENPRVNYGALKRVKMQILRRLIDSGWGRDLWVKYADSSLWTKRIDQYASFMALKDLYEGAPWWQWPESAMDELRGVRKEMRFYQTLQAIAHHQFFEVSRYARLKGIKLMGDLPILLAKDSCEVFFDRKFFNLGTEVGAPADQFSQEGQNWGFPAYRWDVMSEEGYSWWTQRITWAELYFELYRLDHIAGFFGLWCIPPGKKGSEGNYFPKEIETRLELGQARLAHLLEKSFLLPVGEDLGNIDPSIRKRLSLMGIPGIKVMRWERFWESSGEFIPTSQYPRNSLACVSTHDSSTLRQWIEEDEDKALRLGASMGLELKGESKYLLAQEILKFCHNAPSALKVNLLVDYLDCFAALSGESSSEYRINVPGTVQESNWSLRYPHTVEELMQFAPLEILMRTLCTPSHE
jgi:4-alpha-glucanotransferase